MVRNALKESVKEDVAKRTGGDVAVRVWKNGDMGPRSEFLRLLSLCPDNS